MYDWLEGRRAVQLVDQWERVESPHHFEREQAYLGALWKELRTHPDRPSSAVSLTGSISSPPATDRAKRCRYSPEKPAVISCSQSGVIPRVEFLRPHTEIASKH